MPPKANITNREGGYLVAVIGDEDTVTGFLLSGIGNMSSSKQSNYFLVDPSCVFPKEETPTSAIEEAFNRFTSSEEIAIVLINQYLASEIRPTVNAFKAPVPAVLEIPSKEHPYDSSQDGILKRVKNMLGVSSS